MNYAAQVVGVSVAKGPRIMLASGRWFDLLDPHGSDFTIEDVAHGLSLVCRYAGQCHSYFSVAEHSLLVASVAETFKYEALLHDAAEAFIGDITRPLKQLLPEYKRIEALVEDAVIERFEMNPNYRSVVKAADLQVLAAEQAQIMPLGCADWAAEAAVKPADVLVRSLSPAEAEREFLDQYQRLKSAH